MPKEKSKANGKEANNGRQNEMEWLVGNLNRILADLAMYPPDMTGAWKISHEDPRGRILVEFQPSKA